MSFIFRRKKDWRKLEERALGSTVYRGYRKEPQRSFGSVGRRPDIFAVNPHKARDRIVGEAKFVKELKPRHVRQAIRYKGYPAFAKTGIIHVARDTKVPRRVRDLAGESNIKIIRTRQKKKKFLGLF